MEEMNEITIQTVKEQRDLETNKLICYLVDGVKSVPNCIDNRDYQEVLQWISEGNTPEPEFTDEELRTKFENGFRQNRDSLLSTVIDHYQKPLVWESLTVEQQDKVRVYRQALLDSTTNWILPEELVL